MAEPIENIFGFDFGIDDVDKGEENILIDDFTEDNIETFGEAETSFNLLMPPEIGSDIREIKTQKAADEFYKSVTELGWNIDRLAPLKYKEYFELDQITKHLYLKYGDELIKLTYENNPNKFLSLSKISRKTSVVLLEMS